MRLGAPRDCHGMPLGLRLRSVLQESLGRAALEPDRSRARAVSVVADGVLARMVDALHPHTRGRLAGKAQDVAAGHRKAEILSQPRHLVCRDRLLHLLLQRGISLHAREEVSELLERHRRLPAVVNLTAASGKSAFTGSWLNQR